MLFYYNSREIKYKNPFGSVATGVQIKFRVDAIDGVYVNDMHLILTKDGGQDVYYDMNYMGKEGDRSIFELKITLNEPGLYWYKFGADTELGWFLFGKKANGQLQQNGKPFQLTVYDKNYVTPQRQQGGVIYQIFADRFNKGKDDACRFEKRGVLKEWDQDVTIVDSDGVFRANDFFGGNLQGIIDKLPYLKKLGVTLIYLSPIFKSSSNHRYDTGDYMQIDELLGNEKSFKKLVDSAKKMGIGIMLDGVFNHTGSDSLYFNKFNNYNSVGAYQGVKSPYYDWYHFINYPNEYACWWGITVTPTVNKKNESYRQFILGENGVLDKWTKQGIEGWRLDVVDELDIEFVNDIRKRVKTDNKNAYVIGEVWEDASNKIAYSQRRPYLLGGQLDGVMNYPFKNAIIDYIINKNHNTFLNSIMTIYENYPLQALNCCMNFLGTHDTVRAINRLSDFDITNFSKEQRLKVKLPKDVKERAKKKLKFASAIMYALPGIPTIYYGDEVGLEGYEDPINRRPFPWNNIDNDLLSHYQKLGKLRGEYKDYFAGEMQISFVSNVLYIKRYNNDSFIQFIFNNTANIQKIKLVNAQNCITKQLVDDEIELNPYDFIVVKCENV